MHGPARRKAAFAIVASLAALPLVFSNAGRGVASSANSEDAALERQTFALTDGYRREKGLGGLTWNDRLSEIARDHSRGMAKRSTLDHDGFDARKKAMMDAVPYQAVAENVFRTTRKLEEVADAALKSWVESKGHRKNLEGDFALSGMGVARGSDGRIYLTQLFVKKQGPEFAQ